MFGLTIEKIAIIAVIAVFLVGPERLPLYAGRLASFARGLRDMADGAKTRMKEEFGPEFDEIEWKKLDPRQYDPRRIVREALASDEVVQPQTTGISPTFRTIGGRYGSNGRWIAEPVPDAPSADASVTRDGEGS